LYRNVKTFSSCFSVAADFISRGKLKVGSCELSITEFTGNVHEFPSSPNEVEQPRDVSKLSEHSRDVNTQLDDVPRPEGSSAY